MEAISRMARWWPAEVTRLRGSGVGARPGVRRVSRGRPGYVIGSALEGRVLKEGGVCDGRAGSW